MIKMMPEHIENCNSTYKTQIMIKMMPEHIENCNSTYKNTNND